MNLKSKDLKIVVVGLFIGIGLFWHANQQSWFDLNLQPYNYEYPNSSEWKSQIDDLVDGDIDGLNRCFDFGQEMVFREFYENNSLVGSEEVLAQYVSGLDKFETEGISLGWNEGKEKIASESAKFGKSSIRRRMSVPTMSQVVFLIYTFVFLSGAFWFWKTNTEREGRQTGTGVTSKKRI